MKSWILHDVDPVPWALERGLQRQGFSLVAGIDEVGRGALAGPVVAAAVILRADRAEDLVGKVRDSKQMTARQRERVASLIDECALTAALGIVEPLQIDRLNILKATLEAMQQAVFQLNPPPSLCLVDGPQAICMALPQRLVIDGDARVLSISAASVLAKVARDKIMVELDRHHPGYGFARNKGYGTRQHQEALFHYGPCDQHRKSFSLGSSP